MRKSIVVLGIVAAAALAAAGYVYMRHTLVYETTAAGTLKGKLQVEWVDQDTFLFIPDPANPLTYTRANKEVVQPGMMRTDFGSVPVALRALKSYSPWGYAPAFLIHDWLFVMKHCKLPGHEKLDLDGAATIMAEALKTMMESKRFGEPNKLVHYSMYEAVRTSTARDYWDKGTCPTAQDKANKSEQQGRSAGAARAPASESAAPAPAASGVKRYTIEFK
jgi:Protein of unknown function (DUF1353)